MNLTDYSEIQNILGRHNFRFSKSLGQNFLTSADVVERIAESSLADENTDVLEIGPGIGCLTRELSRYARRVVSVEADRGLAPILQETLADCPNVELVFADALKTDLKSLGATRVCANLPYSITSPIITALIKADRFESITVMIQREVARRIAAQAGDDDYSAFGVFVQWYCSVEQLFDVPPSCFVPRPKVTSTVIRMTARREHPAQVSDEAFMFRLIRATFNMRRKTFANAVSSNLPEVSRQMAEEALLSCGLDVKIRGEMLSIGDFAAISDEICRKL